MKSFPNRIVATSPFSRYANGTAKQGSTKRASQSFSWLTHQAPISKDESAENLAWKSDIKSIHSVFMRRCRSLTAKR